MKQHKLASELANEAATARRLKVLVVHGEPLMQIGLQSALSCCDDFHVQSIREGRLSPACAPELASCDVAVTDFDIGMALARSANGFRGRVLIITNEESEVGIRGAMEAGVRGYLPPGSTLDLVAQAVRRVGRGGTAIDPRALAKMLDSLNGDPLTDREIDVLRLIVLGRSNKEVAGQLGIAVGTAKCHVRQLMAKLNARSRTEVASIAQRRGLVPSNPRRSPSANVNLPAHGASVSPRLVHEMPRASSPGYPLRSSTALGD